MPDDYADHQIAINKATTVIKAGAHAFLVKDRLAQLTLEVEHKSGNPKMLRLNKEIESGTPVMILPGIENAATGVEGKNKRRAKKD